MELCDSVRYSFLLFSIGFSVFRLLVMFSVLIWVCLGNVW